LDIYNLLGQQIVTLVDRMQKAGHFRSIWDGKDQNGKVLPSGVYVYQLQAENFSEVKKMLLMH